MPLPESLGGSSAAASETGGAKSAGRSATNESGDLAASIDFFNEGSGGAADDNDPNYGPRDSDELEDATEGDEGAEDGEESEGEESGEVAEEEEEAGEGEDGEEGDETGDPLDAEGQEQAAKGEKTATVSIGDKDYDVPVTATVPTKVNGEIENPTIQELQSAYSSRASIRKDLETAKAAKADVAAHRRSVLRDLEKKEIDLTIKQKSQHQGREHLAKGDLEQALNEFFEFSPDIWDKFDDVMSNYYSQFAKLPADTRRATQLDRRAKMMEMRARREQEVNGFQQTVDSFNSFKTKRCEQFGVTQDEVEDAWDGIVARANKGEFTKEQIEQLQKAKPEEQWDTAMSEALATKVRSKITDAIKSKFPKLQNKTQEIIKGLEETRSGAFLTKATKEEIAGIIAREYNEGKPGKTGKKVATTNSLRDKAQPRHRLREAATQEDEDDIYDQSGRDDASGQVWGMSR